VVLRDLDGEERIVDRLELERDQLILVRRGALPVIDGLLPRRLGRVLVLKSKLRASASFVKDVDRFVRQKSIWNVSALFKKRPPPGAPRNTDLLEKLL